MSSTSTAVNFRDFGGLPTHSGRRVRTGQLYRSGRLAGASEPIARALLELDFAVVADLRYADERLAAPSPWPRSHAQRVLAHDQDRAEIAPHLRMMGRALGGTDDVRDF